MAKKGMKRPEITKNKPKNDISPVPQIQGKARSGKVLVFPIIPGTVVADQKVFHTRPFSTTYQSLDNDLALENLENDIPFADLQDL